MGQFWDKLKVTLGFCAPVDSPPDADSQRIEDRILNADKHKFKTEEPEPQPS